VLEPVLWGKKGCAVWWWSGWEAIMDKKETLWFCYRRGEKDKKGKKRRKIKRVWKREGGKGEEMEKTIPPP
jgi:hypothetical protein